MSRGQVHNALTRGSLSSALTRAVGDVEGDNGLERYGETLTPTLNLWAQVEWAYLRREIVAAFSKTQAAVAGELGAIALVNPTGSGKLYVVEAIKAFTDATMQFSVDIALEGVITATLGAVSVPSSVDTRWRDRVTGADQTTGVVYGGSDPAGIAGQVERFVAPSNDYGFALSTPFVLQPGWGVAVVGNTVNRLIEVAMRYRERRVFPGELE